MMSTNTACFTHLCGNCPCTDKQSIKIGIGTQLRTPKKGNKKDWKDFLMYLYNRNPYFKNQIIEYKLIEKFNIDLKTIDNRRNKYEEYQGKTISNKTKNRYNKSTRPRIISRIEETKSKKSDIKALKFLRRWIKED